MNPVGGTTGWGRWEVDLEDAPIQADQLVGFVGRQVLDANVANEGSQLFSLFRIYLWRRGLLFRRRSGCGMARRQDARGHRALRCFDGGMGRGA